MVGRALHREVERDLQAVRVCGRHEPPEVVDIAEVGMDRIVPAGLVADRVDGADVARLSRQRVVLALPLRVPDRVDRRKV